MSGHSKWATTKHKKAAIDAKRGKLFARLIKNILAGSAYKFINQFAALKEQNSRNIPHAELCCNFIILFNIALTDNDFPIVIIS